jgi:hypothetical protein
VVAADPGDLATGKGGASAGRRCGAGARDLGGHSASDAAAKGVVAGPDTSGRANARNAGEAVGPRAPRAWARAAQGRQPGSRRGGSGEAVGGRAALVSGGRRAEPRDPVKVASARFARVAGRGPSRSAGSLGAGRARSAGRAGKLSAKPRAAVLRHVRRARAASCRIGDRALHLPSENGGASPLGEPRRGRQGSEGPGRSRGHAQRGGTPGGRPGRARLEAAAAAAEKERRAAAGTEEGGAGTGEAGRGRGRKAEEAGRAGARRGSGKRQGQSGAAGQQSGQEGKGDRASFFNQRAQRSAGSNEAAGGRCESCDASGQSGDAVDGITVAGPGKKASVASAVKLSPYGLGRQCAL